MKFTSPFAALDCALKLGRRVPDVEEFLLQHGSAYSLGNYASEVIHGRWLEAEPLIRIDPLGAFLYVRDVIKDRWSEGEEAIRQESGTAFYYLKLFIKDRWAEAEHVIRTQRDDIGFSNWEGYCQYIGGFADKTSKWKWLREGVTEDLVYLFRTLRLTKKMQTYICQQRPDLIHLVRNLDPELKAKYHHELELAKVDL